MNSSKQKGVTRSGDPETLAGVRSRARVAQDALGTAVRQRRSCQVLTLVVEKSPMTILACLALRGRATYKSHRAVMPHIFNAAEEMNL